MFVFQASTPRALSWCRNGKVCSTRRARTRCPFSWKFAVATGGITRSSIVWRRVPTTTGDTIGKSVVIVTWHLYNTIQYDTITIQYNCSFHIANRRCWTASSIRPLSPPATRRPARPKCAWLCWNRLGSFVYIFIFGYIFPLIFRSSAWMNGNGMNSQPTNVHIIILPFLPTFLHKLIIILFYR